MSAQRLRVARVCGVSARLRPGAHPVEALEREAIASVWSRALAEKPQMFDGRVLLGEDVAISGGQLELACRETGFSTLVWLRTRPEERRVINAFGAAVVVSADGAALLGRMARHTANAGLLYFPCGTPDRDDVRGDEVDIEGAMLRELEEETGLAPPLVSPTQRAVAVFDGSLVGYFRRFDCTLDADAIHARVGNWLARDPDAELEEVVLARSAAELDSSSPPYVHAALAALLPA
ncbi:NUDIX hydrolase [Hansschlegelia zhihuaiae]|uniref:NUDIX hydrolase n=1 Tax=Hansschlegelia zhihuaiae TaxID=405005 RepID=A0A4V1KJI7_9HYPH|nr:NUDIX hydrolase [Hansschlegelia zhihuaiae]RXF74332.1 NUDIX hydrolase [Hansschlegelia zhihuaiae]